MERRRLFSTNQVSISFCRPFAKFARTVTFSDRSSRETPVLSIYYFPVLGSEGSAGKYQAH